MHWEPRLFLCAGCTHALYNITLHYNIALKEEVCGAPQGGDAGGQAAISELIKEATLLSSMRHPNVVWVYGIVLKPMSKDDEDDDELNDHDGGCLPFLCL